MEGHLHNIKATYKVVRSEEVQSLVEAVKNGLVVDLFKLEVGNLSTRELSLARIVDLVVKLLKDILRDD